jgi:O-glycosyl hydrolase
VGQFGERGFLDGRDGGKRSIESHSRAGSFFGKKRILRVYHHTNALVWWYIALEKNQTYHARGRGRSERTKSAV